MKRLSCFSQLAVACGLSLTTLASSVLAVDGTVPDYYQAETVPASAQSDIPPAPPLPLAPVPTPADPLADPLAQPYAEPSVAPHTPAEQVIQPWQATDEAPAIGPIQAVRSWLFRRYAGPVEMQDKVYYPRGYYGNYYFRGWKPDYIYPLPPAPQRDHLHWYRPADESLIPVENEANAPALSRRNNRAVR